MYLDYIGRTPVLWLFLLLVVAGLGWAIRRRVRHSKARARARTVEKRRAPKLAQRTSSISEPAILPQISYDEDEDIDPTLVGLGCVTPSRSIIAIPADEEGGRDEPTHAGALIVTSGSAQTDKGRRRRRNEDSLLVVEDHTLYVVADGMGGYRGGDLASKTAVDTVGKAIQSGHFEGKPHAELPRRASELACAIQMANRAVLDEANRDRRLKGMGTTIVAARFSPNKQRMYIGHVGDSRVYQLRREKLTQLTADHTMQDLGISGPEALRLSRAVGVGPVVTIDVVLVKPIPGDVYLLCTDGLTKMVANEVIASILTSERDPNVAVERLIAKANESGGKDNVTVIVVKVDAPTSGQRAA
jgi:protein phosphatase